MLTPKDLRDPTRTSGYRGVQKGGHDERKNNRWVAVKRLAPGDMAGTRWYGPTRLTPLQAALDYCDYMNGKSLAPVPALKSAGHATQRPQRRGRDPLLDEAAAHDAKARELRAKYEAQHPEGYVYLMGEVNDAHSLPGRFAVKIGKSANHPRFRLGGLQTGNPRKLELLGYLRVPDRHAAETALHTKYNHLNILREWFCPTAALMSEFGLLADGSPKSERKAA